MRQLPENFRKNELPYTLIKKNDVVALYGVGGTYTDKILHYEVCRIVFNPASERFGKLIEASESIPGNELFGRDGSAADRTTSEAILNKEEALAYFDELTDKIRKANEGKNRRCLEDKTSERYNVSTSGVTGPCEGDCIGHGK